NTDSAFFYQDVAQAMTDSLYGPEKFKELQLLMLGEQQRQQQLQQDQERYQNKTKMIALWSVIAVFLIIAFMLYRNNRIKQKTNKSSWQTCRRHCKRNDRTVANKHRTKRTCRN